MTQHSPWLKYLVFLTIICGLPLLAFAFNKLIDAMFRFDQVQPCRTCGEFTDAPNAVCPECADKANFQKDT